MIEGILAVILVLVVSILYIQWKIWGILKLKLSYLRAVAEGQQESTKELGIRLASLEKDVSIAGRVLNHFEQETQIIQKRRERAEQIQQRFTPRTPR
jgi:serine phosphatase RsbU (regulator of sigma subunit)